MKAQDVINQLQAVLPGVTNLFTSEISLTSLSYSGGVVTAIAAAVHGRTTNDFVNIVGATNPISIDTLTRAGTIGSAATLSNHDLSLSAQDIRIGNKTVTISGVAEAEFNGTFNLLSVTNRRNFTFQMPDSGATTATGTPLLEDGSQLPGFNGRHQITVVNTTTFTYPVSQVLFADAGGTPVVKSEARISGAADIAGANAAYTAQDTNDLWGFVILGDVTASKNRDIRSDMVDTSKSNTAWKQRAAQPFTIYVFTSTIDDIVGRLARDQMEDVSVALFKSLLGVQFPTGYFADLVFVATFINHGFFQYNSSYYIHEFNFEVAADITFEDTVGYDNNTAFRDIELSVKSDIGTQVEEATVTVDLDEEPL